jgi:cell division initiation protein
MDSATPSQTTLETLRTVEFRLGLKGYNVDEVDEYLEKAAVEAEAMYEQLRQAQERLRSASERISQLESQRHEQPAPLAAAPAADPVADESLARTLLLAQRFVDQAKRESEAEAAAIVAQAEGRARAALEQAEERAREMATESEHRLREEVTRLEGLRGQLASDVENMARHLESERTRLRSALSEVLKWVEDNVQPAASLMATRPRQVDVPKPASASGARPVEASPRASTRPVPAVSSDPTDATEPPEGTQVLDLRNTAASPSITGAPAERG